MKKKRLLLVEDDPNIALLLRDGLDVLGSVAQVETAGSAEEGLLLLEHTPCDLVVTDHGLPGISGLELIEILKRTTPGTITILMTACSTHELVQTAQRLNVYHFLTKPIPLGDFKSVIESALEQAEIRNAHRPSIEKCMQIAHTKFSH